MQYRSSSADASAPRWISLGFALGFIFRHPKVLSTSFILVISTGLLTWLGAYGSLAFIDSLVGDFFAHAPSVEHFWQMPMVWGWVVLRWLFLLVTRIIAFYLAFLLAYSLTSPGYVFLSFLTGNRYSGQVKEGEATMTVKGFFVDLWEGLKIAVVGVLATIVAFAVNFLPVIGQAMAFLIYVFYSSLMFIDFPSSRYRWTLGQKMGWINSHRGQALRMGLLPAAISMIPLINVFFMALLFPLFTVHSTLNYLNIEGRN